MNAMQQYQNQPTAMQRVGETLEKVLIQGDLSHLDADGRVAYYQRVCESLGLNPYTKPFEYLELGTGAERKLVLYAKRDCTDQLRKLHGVSVEIVDRKVEDGVIIVTARAKTADGREDESIGVVCLEKEAGEWKTTANGKRFFQGNGEFSPLRGEARANAMMKAETKAKRRVTLSICGLGFSDESEMDQFVAPPTSVAQPGPRQLPPAEMQTPVPTLDECRQKLAAATDLSALQAAWLQIPGQFRLELAAFKDLRKVELSPKPESTPAGPAADTLKAIDEALRANDIAWEDAIDSFGLECGIQLRDGITPRQITAAQAEELLKRLNGATTSAA